MLLVQRWISFLLRSVCAFHAALANPLDAIGISLNKQKLIYNILAPSDIAQYKLSSLMVALDITFIIMPLFCCC